MTAILFKLLARIPAWLGGKLDGYKTTIAGVGAILAGVAGYIHLMFPDVAGLPKMSFEEATAAVLSGLGLLGLGGKMEKQRASLDEQTVELRKQNNLLQQNGAGGLAGLRPPE